MKKTRFPAAVAGLALTFSTLVVPQAVAVDNPADAPAPQVNVAETDIDDLLSYESANGVTVVPGQTVIIEPDTFDERLALLNVWTTNDTVLQWDLDLDRDTGTVTITAPRTPEEQVGTIIAEYGEHEFRVRTQDGRNVYFALEFQAGELPPEPGISEIPVEELLSYESINGTTLHPGETITFEPDTFDERLPLLNLYPINGTFLQWDLDLDRDTGAVTITAPEDPAEQFGTVIAEYGEHEFRVRTNEGREVYFTLDFQAEETEEPEDSPSSPLDIFRDLVSNLGAYLARLLENLLSLFR